MRLVDILAAELEQWADTTACYVQDSTMVAWPCTTVPLSYDCAEGMWLIETKIDFSVEASLVHSETLAEDADRAVVARWEWEAARAKQVQP